ncbi:MAG TPA: hypothetical protein VHT92_05060 [Candidatus Cybelea sp.]|jgi:hypothetical protein|nr:hypothetical protein [Candidatus Cybelea sp.]
MKASRGVLLVALALLALAALRDFARLGDALPWHQLYDFADFYCAGSALDRGSDPYRYEPLHRCEHQVSGDAAYASDPARAIPAPLPPYDFPPFMLAARLNFATARTAGAIAIVVAVAASIAGLALAGVPLEVALLALLLPAGFVLLRAGQVVPYALLALVFCGAALARGRTRLAGMLAALTLIEPHLGLPVCAAMLAWVPRSRLGLFAAALALAGIGALMVGVAGLAEYVAAVLPAQAAAETGYAYQYSLTYAARTLGTPAPASLWIGELSYALMLLLGVWSGGRSARALRRPELIAFIPAACSVVAGPYVHMVDLPFAIPAAAVLACTLRGNLKAVAVVALCLLAVPWIPVWIAKKLLLISLFVVAMLLVRLRPGAAVSIATFIAIAASVYLLELAPPAPFQAITEGNFAASDLAQRAWAAYVGALGSASLAWFAVKIPTWAALVAVVALSARVSRRAAAGS